MAARFEIDGQFPNYRCRVYGTVAEIQASTPGTDFGEGFPSDQPVNMKWSKAFRWKVIPLTDNTPL
jgi:hypothetical protein